MTISVTPVAISGGELAALLSKSDAGGLDSAFDALLAGETQIAAPETMPPSGDIAPTAPAMTNSVPPPVEQIAPPETVPNPAGAAPTSPPPKTQDISAEIANAMPSTLQAQVVAAAHEESAAPQQSKQDAPAPDAKPAAHAASHDGARAAEATQNDSDADTETDAETAPDAAVANPAAIVPQPVEIANLKLAPAPDLAAAPLLAIGLDKGGPRPVAAKTSAPKADMETGASDAMPEETDVADAPAPVPPATKAKPQSATAETVKPHAAPIEQREAANTPKAETAEPIAAKAPSESKPAESAPAPHASHSETQSAPQPHIATAAPVTNNPGLAIAAPAPANIAGQAGNDAPVRLSLRDAAGGSDGAADMDGLALRIAAKSALGDSNFQIRLDPPELGRIDVQLKLDSHGNAEAKLSADKPQTLDLLQRDAGTLERALKDAGLSLPAGLSFSLKGEGRSNAWRDAQGQGRSRTLEIGAVDAAAGNTPLAAAALAHAYGAGNARLDIVV